MTSMIDAGKAYLAAVLNRPDVLDETRVRADDFPEPMFGEMFEAALRLHRAGKPVDVVTLAGELPTAYGNPVIGLLEWSHLAYNAPEYALLLERHGTRRRLAELGARLAAFDPAMGSAEMLDVAQAGLVEITDRSVRPEYRFVAEMVDDVLVRTVEGGAFVQSPWVDLDKSIGGFRPGAVYVVAARPGVGKTVIAAQIATELANHGAVAFSSLEMSSYELVQRFISERAMVNVRHLKNNRLDVTDFEKIKNRMEALKQLNIAIDDRTSISPSDVRGFVRNLSKKHHVAGAVVDYLQLMSSLSKSERYAQVTEFSRQMKVLAKDFQIPVILLSQLNRASESRSDGVPRLSDLRESGAIEQDADVVMLLRREGEEPQERLIVDVAKNRHGMTGEVELDWQGMYSRAVSLGVA